MHQANNRLDLKLIIHANRVSKVLAAYTLRSEFDPQNPCKNAGHGGACLSFQCWGDRDR